MMTKEAFNDLYGISKEDIQGQLENIKAESKREYSDIQPKLTRREKRDLKRKLSKPKYQKIAKKIIQDKNEAN